MTWMKGQSGNPGGRTKVPEELRDVKALSSEEVRRLVSLTARYTDAEVLNAMKHPGVSQIEKALISCWAAAIDKGDSKRIDFLLDRSIGKAPQAEVEDQPPAKQPMTEEQKRLATELLRLVGTNGA